MTVILTVKICNNPNNTKNTNTSTNMQYSYKKNSSWKQAGQGRVGLLGGALLQGTRLGVNTCHGCGKLPRQTWEAGSVSNNLYILDNEILAVCLYSYRSNDIAIPKP